MSNSVNIYYHPKYNIDLGIFNKLHPFDGKKFAKIYNALKSLPDIQFKQPSGPVTQEQINHFVNELMQRLLKGKRFILGALEVPFIPLLPYFIIDNRILLPMRWAVAGTIAAANDALDGNNSWNLGGGYHHASPHSAEGFCIYNDIGITVKGLYETRRIDESDKILIIDIDAHQGNGNCHTFMLNRNVTILDIYNADIYPNSRAAIERVDINVPLSMGTGGAEYLGALNNALTKLDSAYRLAFVVAGSDVIDTDPLGGLKLSIKDVVSRDKMVVDILRSLSIPTVILGGGGYSANSAIAVSKSLRELYVY